MAKSILNFNVGVLGHIDSGKTSLAKALSTVAATASFDRNPQSQERGITIDLGFSSFSVEIPAHIKDINNQYDTLQFTLVDCPGHASLMKTIIGGAQIIDMMMLVIDVTKGMQTQTAECFVLGEITCNHMIIVLNKIDLLLENKRQSAIEKMKKKILKTLEKTKFHDSVVVPVAAKVNADDLALKSLGIDALINEMKKQAYLPERSPNGHFVFAVDHCFAIKGQGTVMTGTVIQGCVNISDVINIPSANISRKVKSIQMFKKPVTKAIQGDRVGICVTQFESKLLERGIICTPGYLEYVDSAIAKVKKISYFKSKCLSKSKFHISIMHDTIMARCSFFGTYRREKNIDNQAEFDFNEEFIHLDELVSEDNDNEVVIPSEQYVLLHFEKPVILSSNSILIASKLDIDIHSNVCRLAFYGKVLEVNSKKHETEIQTKLKVYKEKMKEGIVERMVNEYQVIARDLFKKETNINLFVNLKVQLSSGEIGYVEGSFGQSGKVNIRIPNGLSEDTLDGFKSLKKSKREEIKVKNETLKVFLKFKKFMYGNKKDILQ